MAKIIYGGGFDPIHNGHLNMANYASAQLKADVIFVPARVAIWKKTSIDAKHKINMINLAIKDNKRFSIDLFEVNSGKDTNYSIDTVKYFLKKYPNDKLYYLIGADQVNEFHRWKDAKELSSLAQIIYFERPNSPISLENVQNFSMIQIKGEINSAASKDIRNLKSIDTPFEIIEYIGRNRLYYAEKIKSILSEQRFLHSLEVAHLSHEIALKNGLNAEKAYIAGILHDIGKDIDEHEKQKIMSEYFKEYLNMQHFAYHQFIGSYIAQKEFEISDKSVLNAIKFHATGNENMDWLAKIVYAADKIEPTRGFDSSSLINAMLNDYENGFVEVLKANKIFLESNRKDINNDLTCKCFKQYL